jgi:hypothetical protein
MALQFGATTYTSLATAFTKAALGRYPLERSLKGHLPSDRMAYTATLELDAEGKADQLVIRGVPQLPEKQVGRGYRQTVSLRTPSGRLVSNLKQVIAEAFTRAKADALVPEAEYPTYLQERVNQVLSRTVENLLDKTIPKLTPSRLIRSLDRLDANLNDGVTTTEKALRQLLVNEALKLGIAKQSRRISSDLFTRYDSALSALDQQFERELFPLLKSAQQSLTDTTAQYRRGRLADDALFTTKLAQLGEFRQEIARFKSAP